MPDEDETPRNLDDLADAAILTHIRRRSLLILEAAISSLLDGFTHAEVVDLLREHAQQLEEHG
jgi:hypothetical protein